MVVSPLQSAPLQEMVGSGALRQHVEIDRPQSLFDGKAHGLGEQPPDGNDGQRQRQARQERGDLMQELPRGIEQHINALHGSLPRIRGAARLLLSLCGTPFEDSLQGNAGPGWAVGQLIAKLVQGLLELEQPEQPAARRQ